MITRTKQEQLKTKETRKREKSNWDWFLKKFDDGNYQDRVIVSERKHVDRRERRRPHS